MEGPVECWASSTFTCAQPVVTPPNWLTLQREAALTASELTGRTVPPLVDPPWAFPAGVIVSYPDADNLLEEDTTWQWTADCARGREWDCPTPAANTSQSCLFRTYQDAANPYCVDERSHHGVGCAVQAQWCAKLRADDAHRAPCCLGEYDGHVTTVLLPWPNGAVHPSPVVPTTALACDPAWTPFDFAGACADVYVASCSGSVSLDGGASWRSALLDPRADSVCGNWYRAAIDGGAPFSRWLAIDGIIERYCAAPPDGDTVSCGCFNYRPKDGAYLYASVSDSSCPHGVCPVRTIDALTSNTLNLSDYACIAPQCAAGADALINSDVWYMQRGGRCPSVCLQAVTDGSVYLGNDIIPGGAYVDLVTSSCGGALATATEAAPSTLPSADVVRIVWPSYATTSTQTVDINFALANGSPPMHYALTVGSPLPPGVTVANATLTGTLATDGSAPRNATLHLRVDGGAVRRGQWRVPVSIGDTRAQYASSARVASALELTVVDATRPPLPPPPPQPNPGVGPAVIYKDAPPAWAPYALGAAGLLVLLLAARWAILGAQGRTVRHALHM